MNRTSLWLSAALPLLVLACTPAPVDPPDDRGGGGDGDPCALDSFVFTKDTTLTEACSPYAPEGDVVVENNATLTLEAGAEIEFADGARLIVGVDDDGRLIADGTADAPVVLRAADDEWAGVTFGPRTLRGSVLEDVTVAGGGAQSEEDSRETRGCVTSLANPGFVSMRRVTFDTCAQACVSLAGATAFPAAFEDHNFDNSDIGIEAHVALAAALDNGHAFNETENNRLLAGFVDASAVIPDLGVPWLVDGSLVVGGADAPTLVIENGAHLRFDAGESLEIGTVGAASLVARSDAAEPIILESDGGAGDWSGVVLGALTESAILEGVTVIDGGAFGVGGCLSVGSLDAGAVSVIDSTFQRCAGAGVEAAAPGFAFGVFSGNQFLDVDHGVRVGPSAVASIFDDNDFTVANRLTGGFIEESTFWGRQPVAWIVEDNLEVGGAAAPTLTLGAGLNLQLEADAHLRVGGFSAGGLTVAGAEGLPVVLESAAATPAAGDWAGVVLGTQALAGGRVDHLELRHAGAATGADTLGCLTVLLDDEASLSVTNSLFEGCAQAAVAAPIPGFSFLLFDDNRLLTGDVGLRLPASALASLGAGNSYGSISRNLLESAFIFESAEWRDQGVPWDVDGDVLVGGGATLTLAAGTQLRFDDEARLQVGGSGPGGLVAEGFGADEITFEAVPDGGAGSWVGLVFVDAPLPGTSIDLANIRDGGQLTGPDTLGAVTLDGTSTGVSITNTTFEDNAQADIFVDCGSTPDLSGNTHTNAGVVNEQNCI
jgi:hypothetical protein